MAVIGLTMAVYLFAIESMATGVVLLVHFFSAKNEISFAVFYIWEATAISIAIVAMFRMTLLRKNTCHLEKNPEQNRNNVTKLVRNALIAIMLVCGTGSGILPLYEALQDIPCIGWTEAVSVSKFISSILSGTFFVLEFAFLMGVRKYRCSSGQARMLVSIILSANVCMLINFMLNIIRASNTSRLGTTATDNLMEVLVFPYCENKTEHLENGTIVAEYIYKYTNTFVLEFGLFAFGILGPLWNIVGQTPDKNINRAENDDIEDARDDGSDHNGNNQEDNDRNNLITQNDTDQTPFKNVLKRALKFVSKHSFIFSLIFAVPVLGFHTYSEVGNIQRGNADEIVSPFEKGNYYIQTCYNYIISIIPLIGYLLARSNDNPSWRLNSDNILLVASGCGHLLLVLFETADSIAGFLSRTNQDHLTVEILYFVKILFHYMGIYCQIMFIMKARLVAGDRSRRQGNTGLYINGIIIFLGVCNMERWLADSFLPPATFQYVDDIQNQDTLGETNWWFITEFLFPVVTFYRLISALLCLKVRDRFKETDN